MESQPEALREPVQPVSLGFQILMGVANAGATGALLGNPFAGALSDRTTSRLGRQRPWLIIGMCGAFFGLGLLTFFSKWSMVLVAGVLIGSSFWTQETALVTKSFFWLGWQVLFQPFFCCGRP